MAKKNHIPMMSKLDMDPIYRKVIITLGEAKVPSFVIFDDQPFDIARYHLPNGNTLIYLNNCNDVADKIINEIRDGKYEEDAPEFAVHTLSNEEVGLLYTLTILISELLDIPCPQVEFRDVLEEYGKSIGERNFVFLRAISGDDILMMFVPLAHELRHLWQYKNHPEYYDKKISYRDSQDAYFNSPAEIDAEAFAHKLELAVFGESMLYSDEYAMGNVEVKKRIVKQMDSISLDEDIVYKLKRLLGV